MIPGTNLFNQAMTVFTPQEVTWFAASGRTVMDSGKYANSYATPVIIRGSLQSINRKLFQQMGLDLNKTYKNLYTNDPAFDVDRGRPGDRFHYAGRVYDAIGSNDWFSQDGWKLVTLVDVGPVPPHVKVFNNVFSNVFG